MPITKLNRRRSIVVLLCVMLLFGTVFSTTVFADTALISSAPMTSYFETYTSTGAWTDLQTPAHWITATGEVAYCLQTAKDNPYNAGYYTKDGKQAVVTATGIEAIRTTPSTKDNVIYDLQGRKVSKEQLKKGLYIVNGKKVVTK